MAEFVMPSLGADMEAGTLVEWRKHPGDRVSRGDIIAEVETEKGIIEVEVFTSGVVQKLLVEPGTKVPVGTPLALLDDGTATPAPKPAAEPPRARGVEAGAGPAPKPAAEPPRARVRVSPAARRRAEQLGVDLASVSGTGPDSAVTLEDVERTAAGAAAPPPPRAEATPARAPATDEAKARMRQAIAAAMTRSKREIPHYYVSDTVDIAPALAWLERHNAAAAVPDRLIPAVLFIKAVALALRDFPPFNGFFTDGRFVPGSGIHIGAAIALRGGGLVAPALRDTDQASLPELMARFRDLVARARAGSLRSSEMSDATITTTSLGDRGTEAVLGVIYPPQVALVGFGRIVERPWVVGGAVVPRSVVHLSLAADHRATDGHAGALFIAAVGERLAKPESL